MRNNDAEYRQNITIIITSVVLFFSSIAYALRLYSRRISRASFGAEDWVMGIALVRRLPLTLSYIMFASSLC